MGDEQQGRAGDLSKEQGLVAGGSTRSSAMGRGLLHSLLQRYHFPFALLLETGFHGDTAYAIVSVHTHMNEVELSRLRFRKPLHASKSEGT